MARKNKARNPNLQDPLHKGIDGAMNRTPPDEFWPEYRDNVSDRPPGQGDPTEPGSERIDWVKVPRR